jgi:hypothetical protein
LETLISHFLKFCFPREQLIKYNMNISAGGGNIGAYLSTPRATFSFSGRVTVV